jgi:DNA polymerase-4
MDAFYASVELRRRPEHKGQPVIVGGLGSRSVVLAATYEAREFGVHSAMPMMRARRLCPQAVIISPDSSAYAEASRGVMAVFASITPLVEPLSLDEAFLDVAGAGRRLGSPRQIGELIRSRIADEQRLPCSVGVASSKFVAKLASGLAKPDGLLVVPRDEVISFLHPLPVSALWGVGEKTEESLARLGLRTIGDIANTPETTLVRGLGAAVGAHLFALAWGRDQRSVEPHEPDRSIGAEETFSRDIDDPAIVARELLRLSEKTAARLRAAGHVGRTVSIKVRFADFTTVTRSRTLREPTDVTRVVYDTACELWEALGKQGALIRLVGVRIEGLAATAATPRQLALSGGDDDWRAAEQAVDAATARFGSGAIRPATLVEREPSGKVRGAN